MINLKKILVSSSGSALDQQDHLFLPDASSGRVGHSLSRNWETPFPRGGGWEICGAQGSFRVKVISGEERKHKTIVQSAQCPFNGPLRKKKSPCYRFDQVDFFPVFKHWVGKGNRGSAETLGSQRGQQATSWQAGSDLQLQSHYAFWAVCSNQRNRSTFSVFAGKAAADRLVIEKLRIWLSLRAEHDNTPDVSSH